MAIGRMINPIPNEPRVGWYRRRNHNRIPRIAESKNWLDAFYAGGAGSALPRMGVEDGALILFSSDAPVEEGSLLTLDDSLVFDQIPDEYFVDLQTRTGSGAWEAVIHDITVEDFEVPFVTTTRYWRVRTTVVKAGYQNKVTYSNMLYSEEYIPVGATVEVPPTLGTLTVYPPTTVIGASVLIPTSMGTLTVYSPVAGVSAEVVIPTTDGVLTVYPPVLTLGASVIVPASLGTLRVYEPDIASSGGSSGASISIPTTHGVLAAYVPAEVGTMWILEDGIWDDQGVWRDDETWEDG